MPIKPRGSGLEISVQVTRDGTKRRFREIVRCSYEDAQAIEAQVRADLLAGRDPKVTTKLQRGSKGIRLEDALNVAYREYWENGKNAQNNARNITEAVAFFGANTCIDEITTQEADRYVRHLKARDLAPSTINQKCCTLTKALRHFHQRGLLKAMPHFERPSIGNNERGRPFTHEETDTLLDLFENAYDYVTERRGERQGSDYVDIFSFLLDVGCRPSEMRAIEASWVSCGRVHLKKTKNNLSRTIPLTQRAQLAFNRQVERNGNMPFAWATNQVIRHAWDWAKANMGLKRDTDFIPYSLRDTCASRLYAKTRDIMLVRKWLGHKNLQVTMRYTDLDPFELDQARDLMEAA